MKSLMIEGRLTEWWVAMGAEFKSKTASSAITYAVRASLMKGMTKHIEAGFSNLMNAITHDEFRSPGIKQMALVLSSIPLADVVFGPDGGEDNQTVRGFMQECMDRNSAGECVLGCIMFVLYDLSSVVVYSLLQIGSLIRIFAHWMPRSRRWRC